MGPVTVQVLNAAGGYVGKPNLIPAVETTPVEPGGTFLLFGTGFGLTNPRRSAGEIVPALTPLASPVTIRIGGVEAKVKYAGLVSSGLYQFNVVVANVPHGDQSVVAEIGGHLIPHSAIASNGK